MEEIQKNNYKAKFLKALGSDFTFKRAIITILLGIIILNVSAFNSGVKAISDVAKTFVKHPVTALILICAFCYSFYTMAKAREERDILNKQAYHYEQQIDSLKLYIGH